MMAMTTLLRLLNYGDTSITPQIDALGLWGHVTQTPIPRLNYIAYLRLDCTSKCGHAMVSLRASKSLSYTATSGYPARRALAGPRRLTDYVSEKAASVTFLRLAH